MATSSPFTFVRTERSTLRRIYVIAAGWFFLFLGIAGLILPILPGWIFIALGLLILSTEYVWAHHLLRRAGDRFPRLGAALEQARHKVERWF